MIWRDTWTDTPDVVILAGQDAQDGVIEDAVLMLRETVITDRLSVSDVAGNELSVHLPAIYQHADPLIVGVGIDLTVETTK
ncbi:hypothetical protein [Deinococcus sp. UYEF24]